MSADTPDRVYGGVLPKLEAELAMLKRSRSRLDPFGGAGRIPC